MHGVLPNRTQHVFHVTVALRLKLIHHVLPAYTTVQHSAASFMESMLAESPRQKSLATRLLHPPKVTQDPYGAVAPPLYQTATFDQVSAVQCGPYDYTRSGNPTRDQLEAQMADLEVLFSPALIALHVSSADTCRLLLQCC